MPTLAEIRARPGGDAYADMNDQQLADAVYGKFYSDLPREDFNKKIGLSAAALEDERPFTEKLGSFFKKVYENPPPFSGAVLTAPKRAKEVASVLASDATPEEAEKAAGVGLEIASIVSPLSPGAQAVRALGASKGAIPPPLPARAVPSSADEALGAAGRIGVEIPKYLATEGTAIPQVAAGIKNIPMAGEPIIQSAQRLSEQMGRVKNELIPGSGSPAVAGSEAKAALEGWIREGSKKPISAAYKAVDDLIDPAIMGTLENTGAVARQIMDRRVNARIPGTSKAVDTVLDAVLGPMDYQGIKALRSHVGEMTPQEMVAGGINAAENKQIYGALTKDLENIVRTAGGADATYAWRHANTLARLSSMQRNALTKITGLKGDAAPEAVFSKIAAYAGSKSGADIAKLRLAKGTLGPRAWDEVGSAFLARLGSDAAGDYTATRFVTGFGNLSPAAKKELFKPDHLAALNDLFTVSKYVRDRIDRFSNPSGTARSIFTGSALGGMLIDPITIISSMVGGRVVAEALSRPAVVRAAAASVKAAVRRDPVLTRAAVARLRGALVRGGLISAGTNLQNLRPESR